MERTMKKNSLFIYLSSLFAAVVISFVILPGVVFADSPLQDVDTCQKCHAQTVDPWSQSHHIDANVTCEVCHKLQEGEGEHPFKKFSVEPEELTCMVCHTSVAGADVTGQLALSAHGQVGLTCTTCHEPHSQGPVLAPGSSVVCENCHKNESSDLSTSTHHAAGLSCVNCHMGPDRDHSQMIKGETCGACHTDLHASKALLDAGVKVQPMATPMAVFEPAAPEVVEEAEPAGSGGVTLPGWLLLLAGLLAGGIISWTIFAKEPGEPNK